MWPFVWPFVKERKIVSVGNVRMPAEVAEKDAEIDEQALADLCAEIRAVLDAELNAGNQINGVSRGDWPKTGSIVVAMKGKFFTKPQSLPDCVQFVPEDMHWIGESYYCHEHDDVIIASL